MMTNEFGLSLFDNIGWAMLMAFQTITVENWSTLMEHVCFVQELHLLFYFILFCFVCYIVILLYCYIVLFICLFVCLFVLPVCLFVC